MANRFVEFIAVTVYLFLEWIRNMDKMPRWFAAMLLMFGILLALIAGAAISRDMPSDIANDAENDAIKNTALVMGVVGIGCFAVGAARYAKKT